MSDDQQPNALHPMSEREYREAVQQARDEWIAWNKEEVANLEGRKLLMSSPEMLANRERRKAIRQAKESAYAKFLQATGGGIQRSLDDEFHVDPGALSGDEPVTNAVIKSRRKQQVQQHAYEVIKQAGGRISNLQLASYLGVSSHGLPGLLVDSQKIRKEHGGRVGNEQTWWVIAD